MADKDDSLTAKIEEIRQMFLQRIRDEWLKRITELRGKLPGNWHRATLEDTMFLAHTLAGSGATFGYLELSKVARKIEMAARAMMRDDSNATAATRGELLGDLELLEAESHQALKDLRA